MVEQSWEEKTVVWLAGVRRVGKSFLCRQLHDIEYFDCELPRVRRAMEDDPQAFLTALRGRRIAIDDVHRLSNPSELLKIAADHYPDVRVLATGSSTPAASGKFRDTLTGRKRDLCLTPMCLADLTDFGQPDLRYRFQRGGLPPFFMADRFPERDLQEWIDSYWSRDIQELFRLERRASFQKLLELLLAQSGGIFEATKFAAPCEASRTTIANYLKVLEATYVVHVIRPFHTHRPAEIVAAPKVYAFDTGFVCYYRGWNELRREDLGILWQHFVLNEIMAATQTRRIGYWRNKRGHEVDFVIERAPGNTIAIECKWSDRDFDPASMAAFRQNYPGGLSVVVCHDVDRPYLRNLGQTQVRFESLASLIGLLKAGSASTLPPGPDRA